MKHLIAVLAVLALIWFAPSPWAAFWGSLVVVLTWCAVVIAFDVEPDPYDMPSALDKLDGR